MVNKKVKSLGVNGRKLAMNDIKRKRNTMHSVYGLRRRDLWVLWVFFVSKSEHVWVWILLPLSILFLSLLVFHLIFHNRLFFGFTFERETFVMASRLAFNSFHLILSLGCLTHSVSSLNVLTRKVYVTCSWCQRNILFKFLFHRKF